MVTKKIESPFGLMETAYKAAVNAVSGMARVKGHSKSFVAACLRLGVLNTTEAKTAAEELGKRLTALAGGKGYASNAARIFAAGPNACQKALDYCENPENSGFMAPGNLFKKFPDEFPAPNGGGRPGKGKSMVPEGVSLNTPEGWRLALLALCANIQGLRSWALDDVQAAQDSAQRILALIKKNSA